MIKKIVFISSVFLLAMVTYKNSAMLSRARDYVKKITDIRISAFQRRKAELPGQAMNLVNRYKYSLGFAPKGQSPAEQVAPYAYTPVAYMRNPKNIPPTLGGQAKFAQPLFRPDKMVMPPFSFGLKVLAAVTITTGQPFLAAAAFGASKMALSFLSTKVPRAQDPFLFARSRIKQMFYRSALTSVQRLRIAFENISSGNMLNVNPAEFPVDIINEPVLDGHTLLQKMLLTPAVEDDSALILLLVGYGGADPQRCEASTVHPVTIVLQRAEPSSATLLALVNPYITNDIQPLPAQVELNLKAHVAKAREKVMGVLQTLLDANGDLTLDSSEKTEYANKLLLLNQIEEAIDLLKAPKKQSGLVLSPRED
jgi:hypothetical protein